MPFRLSLPHFGRRSCIDPGHLCPGPDHVRPLTSPNNGAQLNPPDRWTILSQWQRLGSLDPRSRDYDELLRTLIDVANNRNVALKFTDNDARIVINIVSEVSPCDMIYYASPTAYTEVPSPYIRL